MLEISTLLTGARTLVGLANTALEARDDAKVKAALADLQAKLVDAISVALSMAEKSASLQTALSEAQREKAELEKRLADQETYRLEQVAPGFFALATESSAGGGGDKHYCCQPCHAQGKKSVLRTASTASGGTVFQCGIDRAHTFTVAGSRPTPHLPPRPPGYL